MFGKRKLTAFDADYINNLLKQVHESETIVNRTTNPTVFFGRLNFLFDCLLNLKDYEKYDSEARLQRKRVQDNAPQIW